VALHGRWQGACLGTGRPYRGARGEPKKWATQSAARKPVVQPATAGEPELGADTCCSEGRNAEARRPVCRRQGRPVQQPRARVPSEASHVAAGRRHRATGWPGPARRGHLRRPRPVELKPACAERLG
jgi:hypothetical protein